MQNAHVSSGRLATRVVGLYRGAALLLLLAGSEHAWAGPVTSFSGFATGVFSNPVGPAGFTSTGIGTNSFSWGTPNPTSSSVTFVGNSNIVIPGTPPGAVYGSANQANRPTFSLGTLTYVNGTTQLGTEATGVQLDTTVTFTVPFQTAPATLHAMFGINTTPNTTDPIASADQLNLLTNLSTVTFTTPDGVTTGIEPVGFKEATPTGFVAEYLSPRMPATNWRSVTNPIITTNGVKIFTNRIGTNTFYRLRKP